ncbi:23S rRNA (pseudouridine(1915)-N(3))-methyltransferase RlmH [Clostridium swellfunianum]|uniref:23S rRNA (pseudouridine(1915)-N(3))-methyltransferase RlmH n=1 Tax=Clostridium swellfunianum TaxID=1367462 RepID=UPI0020300BB2|nr:23S rRNA (pseudouridine(1915)-N(3))-methyltransferase RlmH [Clostridium swellfunianum]MCM0647140.1 23S rRNA (pseudouridine(1915)-N(3))-methyltransferase RlmH [Clostridium swellfunianum]
MNITIVAVGKIKEKYLRDAIEDYSKKLSKHVRLQLIEVSDEKTPDNASEKEEFQIKAKEGEAILKHIKDTAYVYALAIEGKIATTEELKKSIRSLDHGEGKEVVFIIGGSLGLSKEVLSRANYKLSFSRMTFPHQLMRVILLEQLNKIINN